MGRFTHDLYVEIDLPFGLVIDVLHVRRFAHDIEIRCVAPVEQGEDPNVCPGCGVDAGDVMREFARGGPGNLSRELLLNGGLEYFSGVIDDGKSNVFENWTNYYVNDAGGKKIEATRPRARDDRH